MQHKHAFFTVSMLTTAEITSHVPSMITTACLAMLQHVRQQISSSPSKSRIDVLWDNYIPLPFASDIKIAKIYSKVLFLPSPLV